MPNDKKQVHILVAEDDNDDFALIERAFKKLKLVNPVHRVHNGQEVLDYLQNTGDFSDKTDNPRPHLVLLDLNMPVKDGREALKEIRSDNQFRSLPVVVLTTSRSEEDIISAYQEGVNAYIRKPVKFDKLVESMQAMKKFFFEIVELPA